MRASDTNVFAPAAPYVLWRHSRTQTRRRRTDDDVIQSHISCCCCCCCYITDVAVVLADEAALYRRCINLITSLLVADGRVQGAVSVNSSSISAREWTTIIDRFCAWTKAYIAAACAAVVSFTALNKNFNRCRRPFYYYVTLQAIEAA